MGRGVKTAAGVGKSSLETDSGVSPAGRDGSDAVVHEDRIRFKAMNKPINSESTLKRIIFRRDSNNIE